MAKKFELRPVSQNSCVSGARSFDAGGTVGRVHQAIEQRFAAETVLVAVMPISPVDQFTHRISRFGGVAAMALGLVTTGSLVLPF